MPRQKLTSELPKHNSRWLLAIASFIFIVLIGYVVHKNLYKPAEQAKQENNIQSEVQPEEIEPEKEEPAPQPLPAKFSLIVPFTSQAPTANWDKLHDEACEEASSIMAWAYFNNITSLPASKVETEITKLTNWQQENYGYFYSITTEETARMIEDVYNLNTEITEISEEKIKRALQADKLVILPANGQMLGNPNFTPPGPIYHMLVITGWNETKFITNDPGTRNGHNYQYTYDTLYEATGNYSHSLEEVDLTDKKIIIVSKN